MAVVVVAVAVAVAAAAARVLATDFNGSELNGRDERVGDDVQVGPLKSAVEVGHGRAAAES